MRLFVAINLPDDLRRDLWQATEPLRGAGLPVHWVAARSLHLTLKFLGQVDPARQPEIQQAIDTAVQGTRMFSLAVGGFGAFPTLERPRVIWVACEGVPPLELLQHRLEVETARIGFPVEVRTFRPHVTLGRGRREAPPARFRLLDAVLRGLVFEGDCTVQSVDLMESRSGADGPVYHRMHAASLVA